MVVFYKTIGTFASVDYMLALSDIQATTDMLWQQIYLDANQKIIRLKQLYPGSAVSIQSISFNVVDQGMQPEPRPSVPVSNKIVLSASVNLASANPLALK